MKHKSIGERLSRAKSLDVRAKVALDWLANWIRDHDDTISKLKNAIENGDMIVASRYLSQLKALDDKRFSAMPNLIAKLADEDI